MPKNLCLMKTGDLLNLRSIYFVFLRHVFSSPLFCFFQNRFRRPRSPEPFDSSDQNSFRLLVEAVGSDLCVGDEDGAAVIIQLVLIEAFDPLAVQQVVHSKANVGFAHGIAVLLNSSSHKSEIIQGTWAFLKMK